MWAVKPSRLEVSSRSCEQSNCPDEKLRICLQGEWIQEQTLLLSGVCLQAPLYLPVANTSTLLLPILLVVVWLTMTDNHLLFCCLDNTATTWFTNIAIFAASASQLYIATVSTVYQTSKSVLHSIDLELSQKAWSVRWPHPIKEVSEAWFDCSWQMKIFRLWSFLSSDRFWFEGDL